LGTMEARLALLALLALAALAVAVPNGGTLG
jgi:hypothetical protein